MSGSSLRRRRCRIERALTPTTPEQQLLLAPFAPQRRGRLDEQPEQDGAVVARQFDQIGLGDEAAELDQLAGTLAALHLPRSRVMPRPLRLQAIARLYCSPVPGTRSRERLCQRGRGLRERRRRRSCATPPFA